MVVRRRKKSQKYRGERHMRRGMNDRARNAGVRGGRGRAGMGKMKDHKQAIHVPEKGFYNPTHREIRAINIRTILKSLDNWKEKGLVSEENGKLVIDLEKLGYNKLIGRVPADVDLHQMEIRVKYVAETTKENLSNKGVTIVS